MTYPLKLKPLATAGDNGKTIVFLGGATHYLDADAADQLVTQVLAARQDRKRFYAVSGRVPGDDEDVTHIITADNRADAIKQFEDELWDGKWTEDREQMIASEDTCVYVNSVTVSDTVITVPEE